MIFKEKYNNSIGLMCYADYDFYSLISDYLMDMPNDVIEKIKTKNNFDVYNSKVDVWYADVFEYLAMQSIMNGRTTLLRIYPLNERDLSVISSVDNQDLPATIYNSKELAQFQYFNEGDDKVISYSAYLGKCKEGYKITFLKASSPVEEQFDPEKYVIEDSSEKNISHNELMNIIDNYKVNKKR